MRLHCTGLGARHSSAMLPLKGHERCYYFHCSRTFHVHNSMRAVVRAQIASLSISASVFEIEAELELSFNVPLRPKMEADIITNPKNEHESESWIRDKIVGDLAQRRSTEKLNRSRMWANNAEIKAERRVPSYSRIYRDLALSGKLGGVIFGCTNSSYEKCLAKNTFCMSFPHWRYIRHIQKGMPLFLFNYSQRKLLGVFAAMSSGELNLTSDMLIEEGTNSEGHTKYPAQVQMSLRSGFSKVISVEENVYQEIIAKNYRSSKHFNFELDTSQVQNLLNAFAPEASCHLPENGFESDRLATVLIHGGNRNSPRRNPKSISAGIQVEGRSKLEGSTILDASKIAPVGVHPCEDDTASAQLTIQQAFGYSYVKHTFHYGEYLKFQNIAYGKKNLEWYNRISIDQLKLQNSSAGKEDLLAGILDDVEYPNAKEIIASILAILD